MTSDALADSRAVEPGPEQDAVRIGGAAGPWRVREAQQDDVPAIYGLVRDLAEYEREPDAVKATPQDLAAALFNPHPRVHCLVLEASSPAGPTLVGMALWYVTFSTWRGRHGLWLEDLFVQPAYRRAGAGRTLLSELARICTQRGYARMEWWVLDWNEPAHSFYRTLGAVPQDEWTVWRVDDEDLRTLAGQS